jgi:hypothetical protein
MWTMGKQVAAGLGGRALGFAWALIGDKEEQVKSRGGGGAHGSAEEVVLMLPA